MAEPLKSTLNPKFIDKLSAELKKVYPQLNQKKFKSNVLDQQWEAKELKQRITHICHCMQKNLPQDYRKALPLILKTAPLFGGYEALFFPEFVSTFGMDKKYRKISLKALEELTQYSSSELAIRPFIMDDTKKVMAWMLKMSKHKNYHMRRLASEGCRPRLPWAPALPEFKKDPSLILPILENLKSDPSLYVRKSVANNLNDISKDNSKTVIKILKSWKRSSPTEETAWITKHSLRSLIKDGNKQALALMGVKTNPKIKTKNFKLSKKSIMLGESLSLSFDISNHSSIRQNLVVDYVVHHFKKNGQTSPKVFKLKTFSLKPGESVRIKKSHTIKAITTRKYYSGDHHIQLQINGTPLDKKSFKLKVPNHG